MSRFACLLLFLSGSVLAADPGAELAGFVRQTAGLDAGMGLVVDDDGRLTAALAKGNRLTVQGCCWDDKIIQPGRAGLLAAGVADRASLARIETSALPYADSLVNLLVAPTWGTRPVEIAEILRVLTPEGIAFVGNDGNPAATAGLEAKLKQAGAKDIKALSRKGWIQFSKPVNPDFDVWTHNLGSPDLSSVNNDKVAGPWAEVRWIGDPRWGSLYLTYTGRVTAGGRLYYVETSAGKNWWVARDAWNGYELWRVPLVGLAPPHGPGGSLACDDRQVYAVDSKVLIARDGRTGAKVRDYAPGFVPERVSAVGACLLVSDIYANVRTSGHAAALDKESGKLLWSRPTVAHPPAMDGVAFVPTADELEAVAIATGATLWKTAIPKAKGNGRFTCKNGLVYMQRQSAQLVVFDAKKGDLLWQQENPRCHYGAFPYPDELWLVDLSKKGVNNVQVLDPRTGSMKREVQATLGACFPLTGSANYLMYLHSYYLDLKAGTEIMQKTVRSPCLLGHVPANGLTYFLPHHCDCGISLRGFLAMAPAGSRKWLDDTGKDGSFPLVTSGSAPAAVQEKPDDWPMYRRDTRRSNATTARLPDQIQLLWAAKLGNSRLTQAVSAYGLIVTAEPQTHQVLARDAATGKERWSFMADGRTKYPPALHKGLCLFSTSAGSVYALDAATGKEIWRLRAAPAEKYIAERGQFASTWPVIGGVMPLNGDIFFTCGRSVNVEGGIWMFAVDAATGKIRWRVKGGVSSGDFFLSDGQELVFNGNRYAITNGKLLGARAHAAKGLLKTNTYLTQVAMADYMACVDPALAHQKHIELTDGLVHGENLAFTDDFGVAAWNYRTGFHVPPEMWKKDKVNKFFIYAAAGGKNRWLLDDEIAQQMVGVVLAGETAYLAGVPTSQDPGEKSELWVLAGADGKKQQVLPLDARPVYDGLSIAGNRLYLATEDGNLICFGKK
jgi:outer membrane protein assembly factor BamB